MNNIPHLDRMIVSTILARNHTEHITRVANLQTEITYLRVQPQ